MNSEAYSKGYTDRINTKVICGLRTPESTRLATNPYRQGTVEYQDYFTGWQVAEGNKIDKYLKEGHEYQGFLYI